MSTRNKEVIQAAIAGFEARKQRINEQIAQLRGMLSGASSESVSVSPANGRRAMSAAARKRISDAKGTASEAVASAPKKAKRRLSPEGRRRIIEATKKRWAAFRAAAAKSRK